jgi:hypothetical protein
MNYLPISTDWIHFESTFETPEALQPISFKNISNHQEKCSEPLISNSRLNLIPHQSEGKYSQ